ncbi:MAG: YdcF family protein [Lachnospiraceae bacterium]|nr:YdcF family protein [Lachnospiraceae bacterium]
MSARKGIFRPKIRILWAVLALGTLLYALLVYGIGSGTNSFVLWLMGSAFFLACFFLSGKGRWKRVPRLFRGLAYFLIGAALTVFIICCAAIFSHFSDEGEPDLDYIIVLGAQMRETGPSLIYGYRLDKAAEYLAGNPDTICIVTGGTGSNESISEGEGGAIYLRDVRGIDPSRLLVEDRSVDTSENIRNALSILQGQGIDTDGLRIGIVTNGFHVYRGIHIARKNCDAKVCGIAAYMKPLYVPNNVLRECFGIVRDKLSGRM